MSTNVPSPDWGALRRRWNLLLDGPRVWGSADVWYTRHGMTRHGLVLFPPGINQAERRRLRLWRGWPMWGALLWLSTEIVLGNQMPPLPAIALSTLVYLLSGVAAFAGAGDLRRHVRTYSVTTLEGSTDVDVMVRRSDITRCAKALTEADAQLASGQISAVDHEVIWHRIYQHLPLGPLDRSMT